MHKLNPRNYDPATLIGFALPFLLAVIVATLFHMHTSVQKHHQATTEQSTQAQQTGPLPSADEVTAANNTILSYCSSDLRQDTSCSLMPGSDVTAPGFVEAGLQMSGSFANDGSSSQGLALAKGSGTNWDVVWVGQNCIPPDVAAKNKVPATLNICSS